MQSKVQIPSASQTINSPLKGQKQQDRDQSSLCGHQQLTKTIVTQPGEVKVHRMAYTALEKNLSTVKNVARVSVNQVT